MPKLKSTKGLNRESYQIITPSGDLFWVFRKSEKKYESNHRRFGMLYDTLRPIVDGGTVVQAGAYLGVYPLRFAEHHSFVHAFEPDKHNYGLARRNVAASNLTSKIQLHHAALGNEEGYFTIHQTHSTVSNYMTSAPGKIHQITIDSLNLNDCSLIQLDVEGAEFPALKGASDTISKYNPVLVLECKDHGLNKGFGYAEEEMFAWLSEHGYRRVAKSSADIIFTNK